MRNYQEDNIPPWKKEVLMRRDGLSKAIENDTECLLSLDDNMSSPTHSINRKKQTRFKIGSSSSLISSVKSFFSRQRSRRDAYKNHTDVKRNKRHERYFILCLKTADKLKHIKFYS